MITEVTGPSRQRREPPCPVKFEEPLWPASVYGVAVAAATAIAIPLTAAAAPVTHFPSGTALVDSKRDVSVTAREQAINASLDDAARLMAQAITESDLRRDVHAAISVTPANDPKTAFSQLAKRAPIDRAMAQVQVRNTAESPVAATAQVTQLSQEVPDMQVAVPVHFNEWDPKSYTPLVAYWPVGVEDTTLKSFTAYDADGNVHLLDAQHEPEVPVIVLGVSEGVPAEIPGSSTQSSVSDLPSKTQAAAASTTYNVELEEVKLLYDNEPWAKGAAETMLVVKGCGVGYQNRQAYLQHDGSTIYAPNILLGTTWQTSTCGVTFYWWEDDGNTFDFNLSYGGVSLGVQMDDEDDLIGGYTRAESHFAGNTWDYTEFNDTHLWMSTS